MDRVYTSGAAATAPTAPASPSTGYPTAGSPGSGTPPTKPGAYWFHMITEELRAVIVAAGLTPDHEDLTQLADAITALSATVPDASQTVKGKVELSTNAETISGISDTLAVTPAGLAAATAADVRRVKGWLNFDGTLSGTITPRASLNVTSVTKSATGTYVANLTTAMADANYAVCGSSNGNSGIISNNMISQSTTSFSFKTFGGAGGLYDGTIVTCAIFGN